MSLIRAILKQRKLMTPTAAAQTAAGAIRGIGMDNQMRSFGIFGGGTRVVKDRTKGKSQVSDDKSIAQGVANAVMNGDIILSDARRFEVNKPVRRSIINIYNPRRVNINQQGSLDKTTESERREQELEAARRMGSRRRSESQQAKNALLGIGAGGALAGGPGDGEDDGLLEDVAEASVAGAAGGALAGLFRKIKGFLGGARAFGGRLLRSGFSRATTAFGGMRNFMRRLPTTVPVAPGLTRPTTPGGIGLGDDTIDAARAARAADAGAGAVRVGRGLRFLRGLAGPLALGEMALTEYAMGQIEGLQGDLADIGRSTTQQTQETARVMINDRLGGRPAGVYHRMMLDNLQAVHDKSIRPLERNVSSAQRDVDRLTRMGADARELAGPRRRLIKAKEALTLANKQVAEALPTIYKLSNPVSGSLVLPNDLSAILKHHAANKDNMQVIQKFTPEQRNEMLRISNMGGRGISDEEQKSLEVDFGFPDMRAVPVSSAQPAPAATTTMPGVVSTGAPVNVTIANAGSDTSSDAPSSTRTVEQDRTRSRAFGYEPDFRHSRGQATRFN